MDFLTEKTFSEKISDSEGEKDWSFKGNKPAIIDFYAEWCKPCKTLTPMLEKISQDYSGKVDFYKVDIEEESKLARKFRIKSVPTMMFIPINGQVQSIVGLVPENRIKKAISEILKID